MYAVFQNGNFIGTGTMTDCIEFIATQIIQLNPEQATVAQAMKAGYSINRI